MRARCLVPQLSLFSLLSAADLLLTRRLLTIGLSSVYESNPLAAWFLASFGWPGLIVFKAGTALLTGGSAVAISSRRPRAGCGVLAFGSTVLGGVVLYSSALLAVARELGDDVRAGQAAATDEARVEQDWAKAAAYKILQSELTDDVRAGRCTITDAVGRLQATERAQDARWLAFLRHLYELESDRDCVATDFTLFALQRVRGDQVRSRQWLAEYRAQFQAPAVPPWERVGLVPPQDVNASP